jgi:hypothetical protein
MTATTNSNSTPWVEKYRPSNFDDIVLDPLNKLMMRNIIKTGQRTRRTVESFEEPRVQHSYRKENMGR